MVPTLTRLGRFSEWMRALMVGAAVVTRAVWTIFYTLSSLPPGSRDRADEHVTLEFLSVSSPVAHETLTVLVFSHRPEVREAIITAVGRRPAPDLPRVRFHEASGIAEVLQGADAGEFDLLILDGEAQPTGGMGVSRQLKNEIDDCPPIIVTVRRRDDRWLATWSQADAVLVHPLDPLTAAETVAEVLRQSSSLAIRG
jgi:CheY-like chemotaxis protein